MESLLFAFCNGCIGFQGGARMKISLRSRQSEASKRSVTIQLACTATFRLLTIQQQFHLYHNFKLSLRLPSSSHISSNSICYFAVFSCPNFAEDNIKYLKSLISLFQTNKRHQSGHIYARTVNMNWQSNFLITLQQTSSSRAGSPQPHPQSKMERDKRILRGRAEI